jgi:ATP-dependent DNA helicase PIF1
MGAMALVQKYSNPDIFLTMTCNPNWDEITQNLYPGQSAQDISDLVVHMFRAKLKELKNLLFKKHILGKVKARVCRGVPEEGLASRLFSSYYGAKE